MCVVQIGMCLHMLCMFLIYHPKMRFLLHGYFTCAFLSWISSYFHLNLYLICTWIWMVMNRMGGRWFYLWNVVGVVNEFMLMSRHWGVKEMCIFMKWTFANMVAVFFFMTKVRQIFVIFIHGFSCINQVKDPSLSFKHYYSWMSG